MDSTLPSPQQTDPVQLSTRGPKTDLRSVTAPLYHRIRELEQQLWSLHRAAASTTDHPEGHHEPTSMTVNPRSEPRPPGSDCSVCSGLLWSPSTLANCGHSFCDTCLAQLFEAKLFACPVCRTAIRRRPIRVYALLDLIRGAHFDRTPVSYSAAPLWANVWDTLAAEAEQRQQAGGAVAALAEELDRVIATSNRSPLYLRLEHDNGRIEVCTLPPPGRMSMTVR